MVVAEVTHGAESLVDNSGDWVVGIRPLGLRGQCPQGRDRGAPTPPPESRRVPVRFGELQAKLRRGDVIGGYVIGFTCIGPFDPIT